MTWGPDHWSAVANIAMAGAAIGGAAAAFVGLGTWKKELTWQNDRDLARRILLSAYRYRDAVFALRNPRISGFEMVPENGRVTPGQTTVDGTATAMLRRLTLLRSARTELEGVLQEVEAQWGAQFKQIFGEIFKEENKLFRAVQLFIQSLENGAPKEDRARLMQRMKEGGNIHFHFSVVEQDEFSKHFESLISSVSERLREKIGHAQ